MSMYGLEQGAGFALGIVLPREQGPVRDTLQIGIGSSCVFADNVPGRIHVRVPDGLALVAGDTAYTENVAAVKPLRLMWLRALRPGRFELRATLQIGDLGQWGELCEVGLPITVKDGIIEAEFAVTHRLETVHGGRRFRYADLGILVPMDSTDRFDNVDFARSGTKPLPRGGPDGRCPGCGLARPDTVLCAVVVDKRGRPIQAEAGWQRDRRVQSQEVVAAARAALAGWRFRPAKLGGEPVYDWCWVSVPVR